MGQLIPCIASLPGPPILVNLQCYHIAHQYAAVSLETNRISQNQTSQPTCFTSTNFSSKEGFQLTAAPPAPRPAQLQHLNRPPTPQPASALLSAKVNLACVFVLLA